MGDFCSCSVMLKSMASMPLVDGILLEWSAWSRCSVSCGNGTSSRNRTCVEPQHGGRDCTGYLNEEQWCKDRECPGI